MIPSLNQVFETVRRLVLEPIIGTGSWLAFLEGSMVGFLWPHVRNEAFFNLATFQSRQCKLEESFLARGVPVSETHS